MPIFRKMYYTGDILAASIIASVIVAIVFGVQEINGDNVFSSIVTQAIILMILYFIIFFIALFALINPFFDFLQQKVSGLIAVLIVLVITNVVLVAGLYPDNSMQLTEVLSTHLKLLLAANIAVLYIGWKKGLAKGSKTA